MVYKGAMMVSAGLAWCLARVFDLVVFCGGSWSTLVAWQRIPLGLDRVL